MTEAGRLEDLPDEELLLRCREASDDRVRRSVEILSLRHHKRLINFLQRFVGQRDTAEDLAQEAFIRVYRKAREYKDIAKFSTWLYRIATNLALNEIRNAGHRPKLALSRTFDASGEGGDLASALPSAREDGPLEEASRRDMAAAVREAVDALPEKYRAVLILCDLQELSYADAAATLEINIGTVRSRLFRARAQFQQRMARHMRPGGDPGASSEEGEPTRSRGSGRGADKARASRASEES